MGFQFVVGFVDVQQQQHSVEHISKVFAADYTGVIRCNNNNNNTRLSNNAFATVLAGYATFGGVEHAIAVRTGQTATLSQL